MTKKMKNFEVVFSDPSKTYSSGDKVAGRILVEVAEVTKVSAVRVIGIGCAKVEYAKGKQRCREDIDYLRYEDTVTLDDQPTGRKRDSKHQTSLHRMVLYNTMLDQLQNTLRDHAKGFYTVL